MVKNTVFGFTDEDLKFRLYSFTNFYLSGIQKGIQTAHVVSDAFTEFGNSHDYRIWAQADKTIIVLNGGNNKSIREIADRLMLMDESFEIPYGIAQEDDDSLAGAFCAAGVIVPTFYGDINFPIDMFNPEIQWLIELIRNSDLAV